MRWFVLLGLFEVYFDARLIIAVAEETSESILGNASDGLVLPNDSHFFMAELDLVPDKLSVVSNAHALKDLASISRTKNGLFQYLLSNVDFNSPPLVDVIKVSTDPALYELNFVNIESQTISVYIWMRFYWNDTRLGWDPADFDNITYFHVPTHTAWKPDIVIDNQKGTFYPFQFVPPTYIHIRNDGFVSWRYPVLVDIVCAMSTINFPYDRQICAIKLRSWAYVASDLHLIGEQDHMDVSGYGGYDSDDQWALLSAKQVYGDTEGEFVQYNLVFQRKILYYMINIIFPTVVVMTTSFLGLFAPSTSGLARIERVTFGLNTILTLLVLIVAVMSTVPDTGTEVPVFTMFYFIQLVLQFLAILASVITMWISRLDLNNLPVPNWVRCCVAFNCRRSNTSTQDVNSCLGYEYEIQNNMNKLMKKLTQLQLIEDSVSSSNGIAGLRDLLDQSIKLVKNFDELDNDNETDDNNTSWSLVSQKLDQYFLIFFFSLMVLSCVLVLEPWYVDYSISIIK